MSTDRPYRIPRKASVDFKLFSGHGIEVRYNNDQEMTLFEGAEERVTVNAGEILALMAYAARANKAWLRDFADDSIEISQDLFEVLIAYRLDRHSRAA